MRHTFFVLYAFLSHPKETLNVIISMCMFYALLSVYLNRACFDMSVSMFVLVKCLFICIVTELYFYKFNILSYVSLPPGGKELYTLCLKHRKEAQVTHVSHSYVNNERVCKKLVITSMIGRDYC